MCVLLCLQVAFEYAFLLKVQGMLAVKPAA